MLIILDRDGVINEDSKDYINSPREWIPIKGSLEAIAKLNAAGHKVVVATNQSGIGRGYYSEETLYRIHQKMKTYLKKVNAHVDGIFYCPHTPDDNCECRKPKPGLLHQIADTFNSDFTNAILVGDSLRDIQAAQAANCKSVMVKTGKGEAANADNIPVFDDLASVVDDLLL